MALNALANETQSGPESSPLTSGQKSGQAKPDIAFVGLNHSPDSRSCIDYVSIDCGRVFGQPAHK